jgi:hypothetical protein
MAPLLFPVPEDGHIDSHKSRDELPLTSPPDSLANPKARLEAITSRPLLLYAVSIKYA